MAEVTYTYSGDPATSDLDAVRSLVGDTELASDGTLLATDEEVLWALATEGNYYRAAALVCESIGLRLAPRGGVASKKVGDLTISYQAGSSTTDWSARATRLRLRANLSSTPEAGGISRTEKIANEDDTDLTTPSFRRGQFDTPGMPEPGGSAQDHNADPSVGASW